LRLEVSTAMSQPTRTEIPASEVRGQISDVISRVAFGRERVIVSRNGKPQAAIIPIADLDLLEALDRQREARHRRASRAVTMIQEAAVRSGVSELTDDEVDEEIGEVRRARSRPEKKAR
jgi:prevent-host-death family protein